MTLSLSRWLICLLSSACLLLATAPATAQNFWFPPGDGNWFNSGNWTSGVPNAAGAWAGFGQQTGNATRTITVDGTATVGRISFTSPVYTYNVNSGGITLNTGGINRALIEKVGTASNDPDPAGVSNINSTLSIAGSANAVNIVNATNTKTLTLASLTGSGSSVTVNSYTGTGVSTALNTPSLVVLQSGTYGGAGSVTTIAGGTLQANEGTGLPTNTALVLNAGTTATLWEVTQNTTVTRALGTNTGDIRITGPAGTAGFSTLAGTMTLNFGGSGGTVQWGSSNFSLATLQFGRGVSGVTDNYVLQNGLDLNGAPRTVRIAPRATVTFSGNVVNTSANPSGLNVGSGLSGGTLVLTGTNTYNGATTVSGGNVLRANEGAGLSANSNIVLTGGFLENNGAATFSRTLGTGAGQVRVAGATSGFSAFGGTHAIRLNGGTGSVLWGSADFNPTTALAFNGFLPALSKANALVDFQNGLDLNSAAPRTISVADNPNSATDGARISGVISNSAGAGILVVGGNGTLELTAANTYTGPTALIDGSLQNTVLKLSGTGSIANSSAIDIGATRTLDVSTLTGGANFSTTHGRFAVASGQTVGGTGTVTGGVFVGSGAAIRGGSPATLLNDPTGQLTVSGPLRVGHGGSLAVDLNGTATSGATVSRVAVTGAGNAFDIDTAGGPAAVRLIGDQSLVSGQSYTYTIASSVGGFTLNGNAVSSYSYGSDFFITTANWGAFQNVSLAVSGSNLVLAFTPVPEPLTVGLVAAAGLGVVGAIRRRRPAA